MRRGVFAYARAVFRPRAVAFVVLVCVALVTTAATGAGRDGGKRDLEIYTQNLYVGTEFYDLLSATTPLEFLGAVNDTYDALVASDPAARMERVAEEIADRMPDVVTLQEVSVFWRGYLTEEGIEFENYVDYLDLLLDSLDDLGVHYRAAVVASEVEVTLPTDLTFTEYVGLTDRNVILVRTDLPPGHLKVSNPQSGQFTHQTVYSVGGSDLEFLCGWCSVDVFVRGRRFRVVDAHLQEETDLDTRDAQAEELVDMLADVDMPVFLAGDFNSDPTDLPGAYDVLLDGGFSDPWTVLYDDAPGLTWGHDQDLADPDHAFTWRLDLILYRGDRIDPTESDVDDLALDRTEPPLWASDHAGLVTTFRLK